MALEKEISYLKELLLRMADNVVSNLKLAFSAYLDFDPKKEYHLNDDLIDTEERLIEEECLDILVKERAYASDLRIVTGILKLVADLERLGDHAEDVLEFSYLLKDVEKHHIEDIDQLIKICLKMVEDAIFSFVKSDVDLANEVIKKDEVVDEAYMQLINKLIELDKTKKASSTFAIYTTLVVKYMERIADHAVNVAEWVIYIKNGVHKGRKIF